MGAWTFGHNIPGYLPESDPYPAPTWHEAVEALLTELDSECTYGSDEEADDAARARADILSAYGPEPIRTEHETPMLYSVAGRAYWVEWSPDNEPEED